MTDLKTALKFNHAVSAALLPFADMAGAFDGMADHEAIVLSSTDGRIVLTVGHFIAARAVLSSQNAVGGAATEIN